MIQREEGDPIGEMTAEMTGAMTDETIGRQGTTGMMIGVIEEGTMTDMIEDETIMTGTGIIPHPGTAVHRRVTIADHHRPTGQVRLSRGSNLW
jgi:hypothetical protein